MRRRLTLDRRELLGGAIGLLALGALPGLTACSGPGPAPPDSKEVGVQPLVSNVARTTVGLHDAPDLAAVVAGLAELGRRLHGATATATANWTVSPLSIAVAFGMLRAGSRGATARQLDAAFGWPPGPPEGSPHQALNALTADLVTTGPVPTGPAPTVPGGSAPKPIVAVANGLFVDSGFAPHVERGFLDLLAAQYGAEATAVRFTDPSAAATINAWVAQQTRDRISKLFEQLDPSTLLVLANAVYLKATWASQFDPDDTSDGPFATASGSSVRARLMQLWLDHAAYEQSADWQHVRLPYVGGELAMSIVLPRARVRDVAALTALLPVATGVRRPGSELVELTLPKWDTATSLQLLPALAALGVGDLSDLAGIAPGLAVSDAVHRANITVDEEGTEAAAVTGIAVATGAVAPRTPVTMTVDRPFAWAIVHEPTGTPVFAGHVVDPTT